MNIGKQIKSNFLDVNKQVDSKFMINVDKEVRPINCSTINKESYIIKR